MHEDGREASRFEIFRDRLFDAAYAAIAPLAATVYWSREPLPYARRRAGRCRAVAVGESWGELFDCGWFHFTGRVPASARGDDIVLLIDVNGEGLVHNERGAPRIGLTCLSSQFEAALGRPGKRVLPFRARAAGGERVDRCGRCMRSGTRR